MTAFRSHSKGNLARYQAKLEHSRMTKGSGQTILNVLIDAGIINLNNSMYYLDADKLGAVTGATYADCMSRQYSAKTMAFIAESI